MDNLDLLTAAAALGFGALVVYPGQSDNQTAPLLRAIRESLSDVLVTMAIAALIGALLLWLLPGFATAGLSDLTMEQLNREVDEALRWLQLGWYLPLLAGVGLVGLGLAGWGAVSQRHARTIAATLGWALKAKAVAVLLVAFSFVGWAWNINARETVEDGRQALKDLRELRLALATENTHVAIEVMAETIADALPGQQRLAITAENFVQVAPYLPHADRVAPLELATQLERRLPDLSTTAARSALDTAVTARGASPRPEQALMKKVLEASFDNTVGTPARDALLAIDNPLINELVGAFVDPIVAVPVREWIVGLAMDELRRGGDGQARRERAGALWAQASDALRARLRLATLLANLSVVTQGTPSKAPRPEALREQFIGKGLAPAEADSAAHEAAEFWRSLDGLLTSPRAREALAPAAAAAYVGHLISSRRALLSSRGPSGLSKPLRIVKPPPIRRGR